MLIGVCNIYAPNDYREQETLWEWLTSGLSKVYWIFLGDFNMVENKEDKNEGKIHYWKDNE